METVFLDLECAANVDIYEFDFLLKKREKELMRQHKQVVGNSDGDKIKSRCCYVPPDYDDFMARKGAEIIRNKRRNIHPAYEVFMQWREHELIQENIKQEEYNLADTIDSEYRRTRQYLNKREEKCLWLYGKNRNQNFWYPGSTHIERGFIELLNKQNNDKKGTQKVCSPLMKKFQLRFQTEMNDYKRKANALRLMEKKIEIRDDAKSAYKSEEDFIDDHLDNLYRSVHYNPVNYGHADRSFLHQVCEYELKYNNINDVVLYSSYCRCRRIGNSKPGKKMGGRGPKKNNGRRLFPDYARMNEDEEKDIANSFMWVTEMFKSTLIINHVNLPIP